MGGVSSDGGGRPTVEGGGNGEESVGERSEFFMGFFFFSILDNVRCKECKFTKTRKYYTKHVAGLFLRTEGIDDIGNS